MTEFLGAAPGERTEGRNGYRVGNDLEQRYITKLPFASA